MGQAIPNNALKLWNAWNVRVTVLVSLSLQILLIFMAPLRKYKHKWVWITLVIWVAYLLADWVAAFTIGHISSNIFEYCDCSTKGDDDNLLQVFWISFLLLHLGGPDTITAFSLEDNELWKRHLLGLLFQVVLTVYTFIQSFSITKDLHLLAPTILMLIAGTIKYFGRIYALYLACFDNLAAGTLRLDDTQSERKQLLELALNISKEQGGVVSVQYGHVFFKIFRRLMVDLNLDIEVEEKSVMMFAFKLNKNDAISIVEKELNFMYDMLYTKAHVIHSLIGYICRFICLGSVLISFSLFFFLDKHKFDKVDVRVTYTLLIGAISLEVVALCMLIFSYWTIATLLEMKSNSKFTNGAASCILRIKNKCSIFKKIEIKWPQSLPHELQHKLVPPEKLENFIFECLKTAALRRECREPMEIISSRGKMVLREFEKDGLIKECMEVDFDTSLALWHVATEICYRKQEEDAEIEDNEGKARDNREVSKLLSDYMLYVLIMQRSLMATLIGVGHTKYRKTIEDTKKKIKQRSHSEPEDKEKKNLPIISALQNYSTDSLLGTGVKLADELILISLPSKRWELISRVWVEMMFYAVSRCKGRTHTRQLSEGGEFFTFVWLLLVHFGFAFNYQM